MAHTGQPSNIPKECRVVRRLEVTNICETDMRLSVQGDAEFHYNHANYLLAPSKVYLCLLQYLAACASCPIQKGELFNEPPSGLKVFL